MYVLFLRFTHLILNIIYRVHELKDRIQSFKTIEIYNKAFTAYMVIINAPQKQSKNEYSCRYISNHNNIPSQVGIKSLHVPSD